MTTDETKPETPLPPVPVEAVVGVPRPMPKWFGQAMLIACHMDTVNSWPWWARLIHRMTRCEMCRPNSAICVKTDNEEATP